MLHFNAEGQVDTSRVVDVAWIPGNKCLTVRSRTPVWQHLRVPDGEALVHIFVNLQLWNLSLNVVKTFSDFAVTLLCDCCAYGV